MLVLFMFPKTEESILLGMHPDKHSTVILAGYSTDYVTHVGKKVYALLTKSRNT